MKPGWALSECPGAPLGTDIRVTGQGVETKKPVCGQIKDINVNLAPLFQLGVIDCVARNYRRRGISSRGGQLWKFCTIDCTRK